MTRRDMLDAWAEWGPVVTRICDLLEHLEHVRDIDWISTRKPLAVVAAWWGIDLAELDRQRRELLAAAAPNGGDA